MDKHPVKRRQDITHIPIILIDPIAKGNSMVHTPQSNPDSQKSESCIRKSCDLFTRSLVGYVTVL